MKIKYHRQEDILTLELSKAPIDHAEEAGPIIAHFSADDELVLLEMMTTSAPCDAASSATAKPIPDDPPTITTRLFSKPFSRGIEFSVCALLFDLHSYR